MSNFVYIATSIDGYIADRDNKLDWLQMVPNPEQNDLGFSDFIDRIDAIVMGKNTFETVLGFGCAWPYTKPVFVCSRTIKDVPEDLNGKVSIIQGHPGEISKSLNDKGYKNLYIDGGQTIQSFLEADLIDELILTTIPVLLGGGYPLFGKLPGHQQFELISTETRLGQIVTRSYRKIQ